MATARRPSLRQALGRDPFDEYEEFRSQGGFVRDGETGTWIAASYPACRQVFMGDDDAFRHRWQDFKGTRFGDLLGRRHLAMLTGDDHHRLHHWWLRIFSPNAVEAWRELIIRPLVREFVGPALSAGRMEIHEQLANLLPPTVIAAVMGLPTDRDWVARAKSLIDKVFTGLPEDVAAYDVATGGGSRFDAGVAATEELIAMIRPTIEARRSGEGNGPISLLWRDGPMMFADWSADDVIALCREMFFAGSDTTSHAISNAAYLVITRPDLAAAIRHGNERTLANFTEEALRLYGPLQYRARAANRRTEVSGTAVESDEIVVALQSSANRDGARYPHPYEADLDRPAPRNHFAFALGPRTCVGAALARAEVQEVVRVLVFAFDDLELGPDMPRPEYAGQINRSFRPLHVRWSASRL